MGNGTINRLWHSSDRHAKVGILMSLFGILGWALAILSVYIFGAIFQSPTSINWVHFVFVPLAMIAISTILNLPVVYRWLKLKPRLVTAVMTALHGFWGQYVGLQIDPQYNGFLILFLFSFGLLYLKFSYGFKITLAFSVINILMALSLIQWLQVDFGVDEKLFLFFFGFSGLSSALLNEMHRQKARQLKKVESERRHSLRQMQKILYPHQLEMIGSGQELESTMPVSEGQGCCLIFQINDSAAVKHEKAQNVFREMFSDFSQMILTTYQGQGPKTGLSSEAYRVSEFGDKFVCTIGFPFVCSPGQSPSQSALYLAKRLYESFQRHTSAFSLPKSISATITVTRGQLEGYYTRGLPVEYQLYGEAMILAERFNELRPSLSEALHLEGSLLLAQEIVFNSLAAYERQKFSKVALADSDLKVRGATYIHHVYVQTLSDSNMQPEVGQAS